MTATGTLSAVTTVKVGSVVSGNVAALHADFNKQVKKGELLAELDPIPFQEKVDQAERHAREGEGRRPQHGDRAAPPEGALRPAARRPGGSRPGAGELRLRRGGGGPGAGGARAVARRTCATARSSRRSTASWSTAQYDVGQTVAASFQAPTIFTIAQDLTKMQVSADVSESDIGHVQGRAAGALHGGRVSRPGVSRHDLPDPPERHGQPERRHVPGHHRACPTRTSPCGRT